MPYVQVLAMKNSFAYIGFCLTDGILKPVVAGSEGGNGGRQRAARTMKIATLYLLLFEQAESVVAIQHIAHCGSGQVAAFYQYGTSSRAACFISSTSVTVRASSNDASLKLGVISEQRGKSSS